MPKPRPVSPLQVHPKTAWRVARTICVSLAWIALLSTPLIGGWQRADAGGLSAWRPIAGFDLNERVVKRMPQASTGEGVLEGSVVLGGGAGVEYFGVPMVDPVTGLAGLTQTLPQGRGLWGLLIPLLAGLLFGRVFCGWFCPFGSLSRVIRRGLEFLPKAPPRYQLGERRWLRFVILAGCLVSGAMGSQLLVTLALPHLVLGQSVYSLWLLGGGGALLGWLLGLVVAGVFFGPTVYCATVCPTGGVLALLGRFRPVRLRIDEPTDCGAACRQCDLSCWLQLNPASGDAGADCDSCGRCISNCPHDNLRVGWLRGTPKHKAAKALPIVATLLVSLASGSVHAADPYVKPLLVVDAHKDHEGVNIAVGVLDESQVRLNADTPKTVGGSELTIRMVRGPRDEPDGLGRKGHRAHYDGPLEASVLRDGAVIEEASWPKPNSPRSTVNRMLYRTQLKTVVAPGDTVRVGVAKGWTKTPVDFVTVDPPAGAGFATAAWFFLAGLLVNAGLLSLALTLRPRREPPSPSTQTATA